jgi:hypothetical protein
MKICRTNSKHNPVSAVFTFDEESLKRKPGVLALTKQESDEQIVVDENIQQK